MTTLPIKLANARFQNLIIIFVGLTLIVVGTDLLESYVRNFSFYLSESLLFSTVWLIFIPLLYVYKNLANKKFKIVLPLLFSVFHLCFFTLLVFILSALFYNETFGMYRTFMFAASDFAIVCLFIYGLAGYLFLKNQSSEKVLAVEKEALKIKVTHQNSTIFLDSRDILYVKSDKPYIAIVTKERTYLHPSSLKIFLQEQSSNFIQIHKSIIVNTDYIIAYTSRKNGDYDIQLENQDVVRASRSYNHSFKPFFNGISLK